MARSLRVGLTGSFGSGKSVVAQVFESCGVRVIDADRLAREVVAPGSEALVEIAAAFGEEMIGADGALDRARMAEVVFGDAEARERLNAIVHPRVRRCELELLNCYEEGGAPVVTLEAPLLYENGLDALVDRVVVVTVDDSKRFERLTRDRGLTREQVAGRLAAQAPQSEKAAKADYVIDNNGGLEQTREQARRLVHRLLKEAATRAEMGQGERDGDSATRRDAG